MKISNLGMKKINLSDVDKDYSGQNILLKLGELYQFESGLYAYGNLWTKLERIVENILIDELDKAGCVQVEFPKLQPKSIWEQSSRWDVYTKENDIMYTLDNNFGEYGLGPTAEECATIFGANRLLSYKNLPVTYYQIGEKFRNEIRTRGYLLRGKAFTMLDAYSFDIDEASMVKSYDNVRKAFIEIFEKLGLKAIPIVADNGAMGGKKSEEFMIISDQGEDKILYNEKTGIGLNTEILEREDYEEYLKNEYEIEDISGFKEIRTMELGHIFQLGTRYSKMMNGKYINKDGKEELYYMGCYGIGVSRTLAAIYEQNLVKDKNGVPCGFVLPKAVAPYKLQIVVKQEDEEKAKLANKLYEYLQENNINVILDDRQNLSIGAKIKDVKILGTPFMVVIGDKQKGEEIELENILTGEKTKTTIQELEKLL